MSLSVPLRKTPAFTLVELLVVIGVIALLVMLHVSARAGVRRHTKVAMCANNVQMLTCALHLYGGENDYKLPGQATGSWIWDLYREVADQLAGFGLEWRNFYCPGTSVRFTDKDYRDLWNWSSTFRVTGYAFALWGSSTLTTTNQNRTLEIQTVQVGAVRVLMPNAQRVLVADATISAPGQNNPALRYSSGYNYTSIQGGFVLPHLAAHLEGKFPVGGNVGMVDGHVEWRKFDDMFPRTIGASPVFWW